MELKVSYQAKVNLLPKKYIVKKTPNWVRVFFLTIMFVATMFHLYAYSLDTQKIAFFTNSIDTLNVELNYLKEQEKKMQDVQNQITIIQKRVDIIKNLIKTEPDWLQIIQTIGKNMPDDVSLASASFAGDRISFSGSAQSIFSVAQFIDALSRYPDLFINVDFQSLTLSENVYNFNMVVEMKKP